MAADIGLFFGGGVLVAAIVKFCVPALAGRGVDPFAAWMALSIPLLWIPLISAGLLVLRSEGSGSWNLARLRLTRLTRTDVIWIAAGAAAIAVGSGVMHTVGASLGTDPDPFDRAPHAWGDGRSWMFALWIVYWPLNILGEELTWRGVLLPRMEAYLGRHAWIFNAVLWGGFHTAFGVGNIVVVAPTLLLTPLLAQRRKNTWVAVALHAALSLPGMIGIAFGWL